MLKLIRGLINMPKNFPGCVATIGNFDGVHLGHQAVIERLLEKSAELHLPSVLITFEPQPNEFFIHDDTAPARLMRLREKLLALQTLGVDYVLCLRFDTALAELTAEQFTQTILVEKLRVAHVLVGDDFRFGQQRTGDITQLKQLGQRWGFTADSIDTYVLNMQRVSSSYVRHALQHGELALAHTLLGRRYGITGRVAQGHQRGRMIGFPTANVFLHRKKVPINGVYAVTVRNLSERPLYGVANVGTRPTVDGTYSLLEVHIFDFDQNIYGAHIYTEFMYKLRDERRFESFELLRQQILQDAEQAKDYFKMGGVGREE